MISITPVGHLAVTSIIGNNPITCLIWGFISHWIMDETCLEYRPMTLEARKWVPYLLWEIGIVLAFLWYTGYWWAILGILPDIIEFGYVMIKGINVWMTGDLLFPFHKYRHFKPMWSRRFTVAMEFIFIVFILIVRR